MKATVLQQIRLFFVRNPDEELTRHDIEVKFGCVEATAQAAVSTLTREGFLGRRRDGVTVLYHKAAA